MPRKAEINTQQIFKQQYLKHFHSIFIIIYGFYAPCITRTVFLNKNLGILTLGRTNLMLNLEIINEMIAVDSEDDEKSKKFFIKHFNLFLK